MKVSIEEIRRQYADLSDEGLLEIEPEDLMEQARKCYDEELARRGLTREQPAPPHEVFEANTEAMVVAATYSTIEEAQLACDLVRAAGIRAGLGSQNNTVLLMTPAASLEDVQEILAAPPVSDEELAAAAAVDTRYIRHGVGAVRPYLYGKLDLLDFVQEVFDAVLLERHEFSPAAYHAEARIGDSVVVMEASDPPHAGKAPGSVCIYVEDVDATYERAMEAGAVSIAEPADKPYQERSAGVTDSSGNTWWISTYLGA